MTTEKELFCRLIGLALHSEGSSISSEKNVPMTDAFSEEEHTLIQQSLDALLSLAEEQNTLLLLYTGLNRLNLTLPPETDEFLQKRVISCCYGCYQMLDFTRMIIHILEEEQVNYYVLKGISLLSCYPDFEMRGYGDVDILVPQEADFNKALKRFQAEGFQGKRDFTDHHTELLLHRDGRQFLLELHNTVIASQDNAHLNKKVVKTYTGLPVRQEVFEPAGLHYHALPPTENALHLVLHMLQHFLKSGFGIRLLCDWCAYLEKHGDELDTALLADYLADLGLTGFCNAMTELCVRYIGLPEKTAAIAMSDHIKPSALDELMNDILSAGQFGKNDVSRMLIMSDNYTAPISYFHQLHRQMKNRFQKLHRIVPLWPVLWCITGICFLWNNHFLRKTKTSDILQTAKKRKQLLQELHLYQQKGEKS